MKTAVANGLLAVLLGPLLLARLATGVRAEDRAITQVVKMLESMLEQSKADAETDRRLYAKFKCYCEDEEAEKKSTIEQKTKEIALLESDIDALQASTGTLSQDVGRLKKDMEDNEADREEAKKVRGEEKKAYDDLKEDLEADISTMNEAITTLADVGADQTLGAAADHGQFLAGHKSGSEALLRMKASVKRALVLATSALSSGQASKLSAFLQAPFTGTYTAQSGEVVGIIKNMRGTFQSNLAVATAAEEKAVKAHAKFMETKKAAWEEMKDSYDSKQLDLSSNDDDLGTKREQLKVAREQLKEAEDFLPPLLEMCEEKAKDYDKRVALRTNEDAALTQAVSILKSDEAFATFTGTEATRSSATSFFQRGAVRAHRQESAGQDEAREQEAQDVLRRAVGQRGSRRLSKILALLESRNPFTDVLEQIKKMIQVLAEEEEADDEKVQWCKDERSANGEKLERKKGQISTLEGVVQELEEAIETPGTGLKAQVAQTEEDLDVNDQNMKTETKDRTEENLAYQKKVATCVEAEALLKKAISVLKKYYSKLLPEGSSLLATRARAGARAEPEPPSTWEGEYKGQSEKGGDAVSILEFILANAEDEEEAEHESEKDAQHAFEDSMAKLKEERGSLQESLAELKKTLAEKEEELMGKREDLKATTEEKEAIEAYLEKIKPDCDWYLENVEDRKSKRATEKEALEKAVGFLKGTPHYEAAVEKENNATLGKCLEICYQREDHAECRACRTDTSVPGYCTTHPDTPGC